MNKFILICIASFVVGACNRTVEAPEAGDYQVVNDVVTVHDDSPIQTKLVFEKTKLKTYSFVLTTSGTVKAIPNNYALIPAPFAGRITKSHIRLGQVVNAGDPIFEICSPSYYDTGKAYYQSKEEMDLANKNLKRQNDLLSKGVGVERDLEEAEVNYAIKKKDFENALASLKVYQVNPSELVLGHPLIVRAPIKGRIVENNIVIGQYLKEDSDPVATVAELSKIWVAGQVKEKDIRYIDASADVEIELIAFPEKKITGHIYHINSIIDEDTRSVQVLIECDNMDKLMKPGMYATVNFKHNIENSIVISTKAAFQMNDASFVFVKIGQNKYQKRKIEILTEEKDSIIIKSGLKADDEIIVDGGFYLLEER